MAQRDRFVHTGSVMWEHLMKGKKMFLSIFNAMRMNHEKHLKKYGHNTSFPLCGFLYFLFRMGVVVRLIAKYSQN